MIIFQHPDTGADAAGGVVAVILICAVSLAIYFAPALVARGKRTFGSVMAINFFLGWTVIGWVVALAWALKDDTPTKIIVNSPATLCVSCGKYSASNSRFCASCGSGL